MRRNGVTIFFHTGETVSIKTRTFSFQAEKIRLDPI